MADTPSSAGEPSKPPPRESKPALTPVEDAKSALPPPSASQNPPPSSDSPAPPPPPPPSSRAPPSSATPLPASENKPPQTSTNPKTPAPAADTTSSYLSLSRASSSGTASSTTGSSGTSTTQTGIAELTNALGAADGGAAISSPGLGSGIVVGIALGAVVLGFALGALAAMFFFRRKHRRAKSENGPATASPPWRRSRIVDHTDNKDAVGMSAVPVTKATPARRRSSSSSSSSSILSPLAVVARAASAQAAHPATSAATSDPLQLDQFLLSPAPDQTIVSELQALDHLIQLHVENYYHLELMQPSATVRDQLQRTLADLGLDTEPSTLTLAQLVTLAIKPKTRHAALRHVIASAMSQSVVLSPTAKFSLLPPSLCLFMTEMAPTEKGRGSPKAVSAALTRWRQISTFLIHPNRSDRSALVPTEAMVGDKVRKLAAALDRFLAAFVAPQKSGQQQGHLNDLLMECAKFGYLLLSQPGEFSLRQAAEYQPGQSKDHLVVCPGLVKTGNEQGEVYNPSRTLLAPATERI
ncbi:hypothetical protein MAPG_05275 [Magnaporthiopsis poae ATCC 64411]|uniref:Uncharacterized protein n=1 Tax=Magnaporthiopsis poae (strain ATCC 64411 / 73-15) TaxID=644358 RepID=A0A0C4DYZ0_MAGP6|nr:hypothetical protein MAPG_05275 [Magnaporthiopsis poae ATCC 64411]